MKVLELLKFIPDEELEFLAKETKVDYQVKKLYGINLFKLLLFSMINKDKPSLRVTNAGASVRSFHLLKIKNNNE